MYKDKEVNKNVKNIFLSMCDVNLFLTFARMLRSLARRRQKMHGVWKFNNIIPGVYISQLIRYSRVCGSYQGFLDRCMLLTRKLTSKVLRSPPWFGWPLWNICVTNDHMYVPLVVSTSLSFPHSRLITGCVTRLTRHVPLVEQELLTLPEHMTLHPFLVGFLLLDL
jgi:hypothetical protein